MSLAAFLLCAGQGKRLRPLTHRIAKPALTFLGRSALEINKNRIETLHPKRWLVNTHHLPDQIEAIAGKLGLETLHESEILGTGGCLSNAAPILKEADCFLVHNADLLHDIDLQDLLNRHISSGALATLAGVTHPDHNTLSVAADGKLLGVRGYRSFESRAETTRFTFAGIAIYRREFLRFIPPGPEDIKRYWIHALEAGDFVNVVDCSPSSWYDFGTPQGLWEASRFAMESTGEFSYNYRSTPGSRPYVSNEAGMEGLPEGLRNVVVYEKTNASIPIDTKNRIFGRDFDWAIGTL
jgi:mannose-1-phosphate guanylyltransferase